MSLTHGIQTGMVVAGYDFTNFCDDVSIERTNQYVDSTAFQGATGPYYVSRLPGTIDAKASFQGLWDATTTSGLDPRADAMEGSNVQLLVGQIGTSVTTVASAHNRVWFGTSSQSKYQQKHTRTGAARFSLDWESIGTGLMHGYMLQTGQRTFSGIAQGGSDVLFTMPPALASATVGIMGQLQVTSAPSNTFVAVIQSSPDGTTWTSRLTFTATNTIGGELKTALGDFHLGTHWRAIWTGTNLDVASFTVAFGLF